MHVPRIKLNDLKKKLDFHADNSMQTLPVTSSAGQKSPWQDVTIGGE